LDADEPAAEEGEWEVRENYEGSDEGELEWTVRAKEEDLDKAIAVLEQALEKAQAATHGGSRGSVRRRTMLTSCSWPSDGSASLGVPQDHRLKVSRVVRSSGNRIFG
jgi:hypothetical protein